MTSKKVPGRKPKKISQVKTYRHGSKTRKNIPTEQTSKFMPGEKSKPVDYRPPLRNAGPPMLSWDRGEDLDNPTTQATPLYIHEKIHPEHFAKSLEGKHEQAEMFSDFNNLPENATFDWYRYEGNWQNRIIRGEARHVMASLLEKEAMAGKVQMIFFDPPYGINFKSNMQANARNRDVGNDKKSIPNDNTLIKAFRDTYKNGIHSYFDNVYKIAAHARELLSEEGSFIMQIGSTNVHRLAVVLDEVFGAENRIATITFAKSGSSSSRTLPEVTDYLLWYAKDKDKAKYHQLYEPLSKKQKIEYMSSYVGLELSDGTIEKLTDAQRNNPEDNIPEGARLFGRTRLASQNVSLTGRSNPYQWEGKEYPCPPGRQWSVSKEGMDKLAEKGRLVAANEKSTLSWKKYENEVPGRRINNIWDSIMAAKDLHYVVETAESVIERCILMATDPGDLVLDPTCGSGTTACVAEKWGRRWITTDCSAVAVSLARQRLLTGTYHYYLLQDSEEGAAMEAKLSGNSHQSSLKQNFGHDPAKGFVYERVPDVSAAVLAYDKDVPAVLLVNCPKKKKATMRVSSPFTVESHSPYRVVDPETALNDSENTSTVNLHKAIVDALEETGIRDGENTISVKEIEPYCFSSQGGATHIGHIGDKKAAILIAPDNCTISTHLINLAAEDAATVPSVTELIVIAFAFEPDAISKKKESRGRLTIHKAQAHQDLRIGNLKNLKEDSAFVLIGEPSIDITKVEYNKIIVKVTGYDTYDPSTGQLRNGKPDEINCWLIDGNHDRESFFAHRIHFPGASGDSQIKRYGKKLSKRVSPELWQSMLSTTSAPLPMPDKDRCIAVRIVTNTHVEMTTVKEVE